MTYTLTSDYIIIEGREPIDRKVFEKWLTEYASVKSNEFDWFWDHKIEWCQPEEALQDFIDMRDSFTPFDRIKKGIDRICK